jgi:outer membrane protein assembly factor BamB
MNRRTLRSILAASALLALIVPVVAPLGVLGPAEAPADPAALPTLSQWLPETELDGTAQRGLPTPLPSQAPLQDLPVANVPDATSAYGQLLLGLLQNPDASPHEMGALMRSYFQGLGLAAPGEGVFTETATASYTYVLGDITGDGTDDVLLDQYCVLQTGCVSPVPGIGSIDYVNYVRFGAADGTEIWSRRLDSPRAIIEPGLNGNPYNTCAQEFLVDAVPLSDGRNGALVYRLVIYRSYPNLHNVLLLEHEYYLLDPLDGHKVWSYTAQGRLVSDPVAGNAHAENLLLVPILQMPPRRGVSLVPDGTESALFIQSIGFDFVFVSSQARVPGMVAPFPILDAYRPREWAAKLQIETGAEDWKVTTFEPQNDRSVLPEAATSRVPLLVPGQAQFKAAWYWSNQACCFDLTGDAVPDLVYWTREWSSTPTTNGQGSYMLGAYVLAFDGATGERLFRSQLEPDTPKERWQCAPARPFCLMIWPQLLGDANGDGASDLLFHLEYFDYDYAHRIILFDGATGETLWQRVGPRNLDLLVVGDATGDGGNDFVLYEWQNEGFWFFGEQSYHAGNVTATPLTLYRGSDGERIWRTTTFQAPVDVRAMFATYRLNGLLDIDGDGVGDFPINDPVFYPDLTIVNRLEWVSGKDASGLFRHNTVGAFAFPARSGDINGDGHDDFALINGDINDVWLTTLDGRNGEPLWSRRVLALRDANYLMALVQMRAHDLRLNGTSPDSLLINLHVQIIQAGGFILISNNDRQLAAYLGLTGHTRWAIPALKDADYHAVAPGYSPLSQAFNDAFAPPPRSTALSVASYSPAARALLGAGLFAACALLGFASTQWRRFT